MNRTNLIIPIPVIITSWHSNVLTIRENHKKQHVVRSTKKKCAFSRFSGLNMKGIASYIAFVASLAVLASAAPTPARAATVGRTGRGELQKRDDSYRRHYYLRYRHHYYYDDDDNDDDYYWRNHHRPYDYDDEYYDERGTHTEGTYDFDGIHGSWDSNDRK